MSKPPYTVGFRRAVPEEAAALTALALRSKGHWGYPPEFIEACRKDIELSPGYVLNAWVEVMTDSSKTIGFYGLSEPWKEQELVHLWLAPSGIGKGYGKVLISRATQKAREMGWQQFKIVGEPNARAFYEKTGAKMAIVTTMLYTDLSGNHLG